MAITILDIKVFVWTITVQKRSTNSHLHNVFSKPLQKINCSCHSCVFSKSYQPIIVLVSNFFIIYQSDIVLNDCLKCWHTVSLCLDYLLFTLMVWEKYKKVLSGIRLSTGTSLIPMIREHLEISSSRMAPAFSY